MTHANLSVYNALFFSLTLVYAIKCYQCSSNEQIDCSEKFDEDNTKLAATSCDSVFEARYCVKTTGIYEGKYNS